MHETVFSFRLSFIVYSIIVLVLLYLQMFLLIYIIVSVGVINKVMPGMNKKYLICLMVK